MIKPKLAMPKMPKVAKPKAVMPKKPKLNTINIGARRPLMGVRKGLR